MTKRLTPVEKARNVLLRAFRRDPDFRHGYIANIACVIYDSKHNRVSMAKCNEIAEDVFKRIFE